MRCFLFFLLTATLAVGTSAQRVQRQDSTECPPLVGETVIITCVFDEEEVDCARTHTVGTIATLACKPGHARISSSNYNSVTCKRGGAWDNPLFTCTPDDFHIEPQRAVAKLGDSITLLANAKRPLQTCHYWLPGTKGRLVDLSRGAQSQSTDHYEYSGEGLSRGHCGIKIKRVVGTDDGIIECKVMPVGSTQWERSVTTLRVTDRPKHELPSFNIVPKTAMLVGGNDITVTCNTNQPITLCHIFLPGGKKLNFDRGPNSKSTDWYRYSGTGLGDGHCGVKLTVNQALTGYIVCKVGDLPEDLSGRWETDALKVDTSYSVSRPPMTTPVTVHQDSVSRPPTTTPATVGLRQECPPLVGETLIITCVSAGDKVDCARSHTVGTIARLACKPGHARLNSSIYNSVTCKRGGAWDNPLFTCTPDCGKRKTNRDTLLLSNGQDVQAGEFPWHVGIYEMVDGEYAQVCGGTLVTLELIISAAHCFWSDQTSRLRPAGDYKVAAGKHMREWSLNSHRIQKREVRNIKVDPLYRGRDTNYGNDIAVLRVDRPFLVTESVNLICVNWDNAFGDRDLSPGSYGIVTGWGYGENNTQNDVLKYVNLPLVTATTCLNGLERDLQRLLTSDKFCAGYRNQSISVCDSDSGGGLVFRNQNNGKLYLRGVVSIAFAPANVTGICYSQQYIGFTQVSKFSKLILEGF